jgi:hypothetical protein
LITTTAVDMTATLEQAVPIATPPASTISEPPRPRVVPLARPPA